MFLADLLIERETAIRDAIEAQPGGWTNWRRFRVADKRSEAEDIVSFVLRPLDGRSVIASRPGQYLTLRFDEAGLAGVKRNYSISSAPNADFYRITVKREPNGEASGFLHDQVEVGAVIEATPPAGDFYLSDTPQRPLLLLSGGVGLTPIVSMLEVLAEQHHNVPVFYVHGTSSPAHHALDAQVRQAAARHGNVLVETFYESGADQNANLGRITLDWLQGNIPLAEADVYLCGPRPFLRHFVGSLRAAGIHADRIHYEFFGPIDQHLAA